MGDLEILVAELLAEEYELKKALEALLPELKAIVENTKSEKVNP